MFSTLTAPNLNNPVPLPRKKSPENIRRGLFGTLLDVCETLSATRENHMKSVSKRFRNFHVTPATVRVVVAT